MLGYLILVFIILDTSNKESETRELQVSLENTRIVVRLKCDIRFYNSSDDGSSYDQTDDIQMNFYNERHEIILDIKEKDLDGWFKINCFYLNLEGEIEIGRCLIATQSTTNTSVRKFSTGYKFKFDKNVKYEITNHLLMYILKENQDSYIKFQIHQLSIRFPYYNRTCQMSGGENIQELDFNSDFVIHPCESVVGNYLNESSRPNPTNSSKLPKNEQSFYSPRNTVFMYIGCLFVAVVGAWVARSIRCRKSKPREKA
ncbi:hypothetical protein RF11_07539 [Thelohanellus kitauei]|uniref:Phosphatidylinositol-glycan biosynthesis class X protein n=1 Tax=Thelohanellus kitauei TaxID=669202 RepID=A0A0C2MJW9_THEKT|nr:hypothetical protein RF11_07539 [Thelohanellus kitauei]